MRVAGGIAAIWFVMLCSRCVSSLLNDADRTATAVVAKTVQQKPSRFGTLLLRLRAAAGLTQEQLAARARLSPDAVSALESGKRRSPRFATVESLAAALALDAEDRRKLIAADQVSDKAGKKPSKPAVCVYDVASGKRLFGWDLSAPCWAIALAPDDRHVAAAQQDGITVIFRIPAVQSR